MTKQQMKWLVLSIIAIWAGSGLIIFIAFDSTDRGTFGDMFGAINGLFSGLALAGVIVAILLQHNELKLQREELALTRKEHCRSAEAAAKSATALIEQTEVARDTAELQALTTLIHSTNVDIEKADSDFERLPGARRTGAKVQHDVKLKMLMRNRERYVDLINQILTSQKTESRDRHDKT